MYNTDQKEPRTRLLQQARKVKKASIATKSKDSDYEFKIDDKGSETAPKSKKIRDKGNSVKA